MAHKDQIDFCTLIKKQHPEHFKGKNVLDVGSLDINGNNRYLFSGCKYTGLDLGEGRNVDIICPVYEYNPDFQYDFIISTEMLEHDKYVAKSRRRTSRSRQPPGPRRRHRRGGVEMSGHATRLPPRGVLSPRDPLP